MKSRPLALFRGFPGLVRTAAKIDALKQFDHFKHADFQPGLFLQLARGPFHQRLAQFERSSRNRPLPFQRFGPSSDQEHSLAFDDPPPPAHNRPFRILPPRTHSDPAFPVARWARLGLICTLTQLAFVCTLSLHSRYIIRWSVAVAILHSFRPANIFTEDRAVIRCPD